ncbi:MAG: hypothetical protein WC558_12760 [Patulibacter sp.]
MKAIAAAATIAGVVALAGASNASALNVGTIGTPVGTGSMTQTALAGSSRIVINSALPYNCTTTGSTSNINTGVYGLPAAVGTTQLQFSSCNSVFGSFVWACTSTTSYTFTGAPVGGVTAGSYTGISCLITSSAVGCSATLSGSMPVRYTNPSATTPGVVTVLTAGQALTLSGSTCPPAILPNGSVQFGAPSGSGTSLANLNYTLTGASTTHPFVS